MIKEMGMSTITMCCMCLAIICAANTISKEIEKGTLMTLLSKPVTRQSVFLGKFLGIVGVVFCAFSMLGALLITSLCARNVMEHHGGFFDSVHIVGIPTFFQLLLLFLPVVVMCSVGVAGSMYLPLASNLSCCLFIYTSGNLIQFFHNQCGGSKEGFPWFISLVCVFFPNLEAFSVIGVENVYKSIGYGHIFLLILYALFYIAFIILGAFELFEKKECG
jgi:ABC-2 type transport system permease protein